MNNLKTIFLSIVGVSLLLHASPDCLDNSKHLSEKYDSGSYYAVAQSAHGPCLCPCEKQYELSPDRGKCWKCSHYRVPRQPVKVVWSRKKIIDVAKLARAVRMRK